MSENNDPFKSQYPALGRWLMWVEKPNAPALIFWAVAIICLGLILLDLVYHKHSHFMIEDLFGFYGFYGFIMCAGLVVAAKLMRKIIMRDEDYYAPYVVDSEEHPKFDMNPETVGSIRPSDNEEDKN